MPSPSLSLSFFLSLSLSFFLSLSLFFFSLSLSLSFSLSLSHLTFFTKSTDPHGDSEIPGGLSQYLDKTCQKNNAGSSSPQHVEWCWNQVPTLQQRQGAPGLQLCLAATPPSKRMENYSFIMLHHAYSEMLTCFSESPSFSILFPSFFHDIMISHDSYDLWMSSNLYFHLPCQLCSTVACNGMYLAIGSINMFDLMRITMISID